MPMPSTFNRQTIANPHTNWPALLADAGLGLLDAAGQFMPAPVSLTPYHLTEAQWQQALNAGRLLGLLHQRVAQQADWLLSQFTSLKGELSLPGQLSQSYYKSPAYQHNNNAKAVSLQRHDLMLDRQNQWRWIESNPIAAGMGPLNALWLDLLRAEHPGAYANNPATAAQADLLFSAAAQHAGPRQPHMVFVVEAQEDNWFDQQLLADALAQRGVQVHRLTLAQLQQAVDASASPTGTLYYGTDPLDLLYFRTGYNQADYPSAQLWQLRLQLEQFDLLLCPTLLQQLAGSKWLQLKLSQYLQQPDLHPAFAVQFGFSLAETQQLAALTVPMAAVDELNSAEFDQMIKQGWWYKRQAEGGGNVARGTQALQWRQVHQPGDGDVLMAPVEPRIRPEVVHKLVRGQWQTAPEQRSGHISELGIFSLGEDARYGGYLLRTKTSNSLEGGVHKGFAVLDTVWLTADALGESDAAAVSADGSGPSQTETRL